MGNATEWRRVKGIALTSAIVAALISAGASPAWSTETPTDPPPAEETLAPSVEDTLRTQEISGTPVGEDATVPLEALPSPTPSPGETEEESADAETPLAEAQTPVAPATAPVAAINVVRPPLDPTEPEIQQEKMAVSQGLPNSASRFAVEGEANTYRIPRPTPGGTSAGEVPAGLEQFYSQKVDWGLCLPFFDDVQSYAISQAVATLKLRATLECAYVIVPVDYLKPEEATVAVAVARLSTGPGADGRPKPALFGNSGGPGQASLPFAAQWGAEFESVLDQYDIVAPDTRGAGASLPQIRCATDRFILAQSEGMDGLASTPEGLAESDKINKANTDACYTNTGAGFQNWDGSPFDSETYIPKVGVDDEARDMDVIRSLLGNERLSYQGTSAGTGLGYAYAQHFPANVRAMILDAPMNPFENNPAELAKHQALTGNAKADPYEQSKGFQDTFYQFAEACARENGFDLEGEKVDCALGTTVDRPSLLAAYQAISQKAFGGRTYGSESKDRPLSFADFERATTAALYQRDLWPSLNAGLAAARDGGDVKELLALRDGYYQVSSSGNYPFFVTATFPTKRCQDVATDDGSTRKGEYQAAPFRDPGKDPLTGQQRDGLDSEMGWCDFYHTKNRKDPGVPVKALPNVLVVGSSHDPATPYIGAQLMARGLGATLLTVENPQHGAVASVKCASDIANAYLKTLVAPTDIPGKTGIQVLDLTQRPLDPSTNKSVSGNECRVDTSFRPVPKVAAVQTSPGAQATLTVEGLVRGSSYQVSVLGADGSTVPGLDTTVEADAAGTVAVPVTVPGDVALGDYKIAVTGLDEVNKPIRVAPGALTLAEVPKPAPALELKRTTVVSGASQSATGTGFEPGSTIELTLEPGAVSVGSVKVDARGEFTAEFIIPARTAPGTVTVTAAAGDVTASSTFTVTSSSNSGQTDRKAAEMDALAMTGAAVPIMIGTIAMLLIAAGLIVLVIRRRQNSV